VSKSRAQALYAAGVLADVHLDNQRQYELMKVALELQVQLGDKEGIAMVESALAVGLTKAGHHAEARLHAERALVLWKELGSGKFVLGLSNLANIATKQGDYAIARSAYEATLEAFRSAGDIRGTAVALNGLGDVAAAQGDFEGARRLYTDSLARFRQIGYLWGVAGVLRDLGDLAARAADASGALGYYKDGFAVLHQLGHRRGMAVVLQRLAGCSDSPYRILKLAGAAAAMRESLGISLSPAEHEQLDRIVKRACAMLADAEQRKAWAEGGSMTADQVLEYALSG
jgi:tetratricopeptide (TPR) repeat protein